MNIKDDGPLRTRKKKSPSPRLPRWILTLLTHYEHEFSLTGDCSEEYRQISEQQGKLKAMLWIWGQVLGVAQQGLRRSAASGGTMFRNSFKITWRNLRRHKAFSWINIAGLAIGLAISILILLWVRDELSFDCFHKHADTICRITEQWVGSPGAVLLNASTPYPLGPALRDDYPEVEEFIRLSMQYRNLIEFKEKRFYEPRFAYADSNFFTLFSFPLLKGSPDTVLKNPNSLVMSRSMAEKYFGDEDPLGKILKVNAEYDFVITGIMLDMPQNSHIRVGFVGNFEFLTATGWSKRWVDHQYYTYLRLRPDTDVDALGAKISSYINDHQKDPTTIHIALQSLKDIHLRSHFNNDLGGTSHGRAVYVTIFSLVAIMVIVIACINFMNLTTAQAANRAKEIGIRKVTGASKGRLIRQFLGESFLMSVLAQMTALVGVFALLPQFNTLTGKALTYRSVFGGTMPLYFLALILTVSLFAGSYPAFYLSAFRPSHVLRGKLRAGAKSRTFRRALVVMQFSLTVVLLIGTGAIGDQLLFMQNKNLGIKKDNIVSIEMRGVLREDHAAFRDELTRIPEIRSVTTASERPTRLHWGTTGVDWEGRTPEQRIHWTVMTVGFEFIDTFSLELAEGRGFSRNITTDVDKAYIINETGAEALGFEHAVGKRFSLWDTEGRIIGVVRDFHFASLHEGIEPLLIKVHPGWDNYIFLHISTERIHDVLARVEDIHRNLNPDYPFTFNFLDDEYARLYGAEERTQKLFRFFAGVAMFISCLGLFGMSSFIAEQRTKEIGIRKVFGANVPGILLQLLRDFTKWVLYANIIAWPIGYFAMQRWLNNFAYRIDLDWRLFIGTALMTLVIAALTVGYKALKAAAADPIRSLRYE